MLKLPLIRFVIASSALLMMLLMTVLQLCPCSENFCNPQYCAEVVAPACGCGHGGDCAPEHQDDGDAPHEHHCMHDAPALTLAMNLIKLPEDFTMEVIFTLPLLAASFELNALAKAHLSEPPPLLAHPFVAALRPLLI